MFKLFLKKTLFPEYLQMCFLNLRNANCNNEVSFYYLRKRITMIISRHADEDVLAAWSYQEYLLFEHPYRRNIEPTVEILKHKI